MNRCIYCNKWLGTADTNNVCSECANERKGTYATTQPIILSRVDFSEKPPTVDEVCKALSDFTGQDVLYSQVTHEFYYTENTSGPISHEQFITETYGDGLWSLGVYIPPHLITLIGRFYEGLEVKE